MCSTRKGIGFADVHVGPGGDLTASMLSSFSAAAPKRCTHRVLKDSNRARSPARSANRGDWSCCGTNSDVIMNDGVASRRRDTVTLGQVTRRLPSSGESGRRRAMACEDRERLHSCSSRSRVRVKRQCVSTPQHISVTTTWMCVRHQSLVGVRAVRNTSRGAHNGTEVAHTHTHTHLLRRPEPPGRASIVLGTRTSSRGFLACTPRAPQQPRRMLSQVRGSLSLSLSRSRRESLSVSHTPQLP